MKAKHITPKGFTLIELIVVIAVLGVLAAGVFAAINPVKRINQAKDTRIKTDIGQISRAMQAYFTSTGTSGTPYYPSAVADLVSSELKSEPKTPGGGSYTMVLNPLDCTTTLKTCTNVAVYTALNDTPTAGNVWCWRSATNVAAETTVAACTAAP